MSWQTGWLMAMTVLVAPTGCAPVPAVVPRPEGEPAPPDPVETRGETDSPTPLIRVTLPVDDGTSDGVAVVRWQVFDNESVISTYFREHAPTAIDPTITKQLARNGLLVAELAHDEIPDALAHLGGTYANIRAWLGQATDWHQLTALPIRGTLATVVDGASRRLADGSLQLLLRGWTVPLESGAVTDLEILPVFLPGGRVPGARATLREPIPSAGLFASLPRGRALMITGMAPATARPSSTRGPSSGPPVTPPRTLGELLLTRPSDDSQPIPQRPVVVIIPFQPAHHFAPAAAVDSSTREPP